MATFKYKVRAGDTPTSLASRFKTSPQAFLKANPGVSKLSQGMTIKVPSVHTAIPFGRPVGNAPLPVGAPSLQNKLVFGGLKTPGLPVNTFEYFQQNQNAVTPIGMRTPPNTYASPSAKMAAWVAYRMRPDVVQPDQAAVLGFDAAEMQKRGYRLSTIGAGTLWTLTPEGRAALAAGEIPGEGAGSAGLPEGVTVGSFGRQVTASGDSYATSAANSFRTGRGRDKWVMSSKAAASFRRRKMRGSTASVTQAAPALANDARLVNWRISSG